MYEMCYIIPIALVVIAKFILFACSLYLDILYDNKYMPTECEDWQFVVFALLCPICRMIYLRIKVFVEYELYVV